MRDVTAASSGMPGPDPSPARRVASGPGQPPARQATPALPAQRAAAPHPEQQRSALYVVLTTPLPDSGLVVGGISAVASAEAVRLRHGVGAKGAFVAAYVRVGDALVPVHVETSALPAATGAARYRIRTWLGQQLLGQRELEIPFDPRMEAQLPTAW